MITVDFCGVAGSIVVCILRLMRKVTRKKESTIDELAIMIQSGFRDTARKIDVEELRKDMENNFKKVDARFDIIENKLIARHEREIEHLRDEVLKIKVTLAKINK